MHARPSGRQPGPQFGSNDRNWGNGRQDATQPRKKKLAGGRQLIQPLKRLFAETDVVITGVGLLHDANTRVRQRQGRYGRARHLQRCRRAAPVGDVLTRPGVELKDRCQKVSRQQHADTLVIQRNLGALLLVHGQVLRGAGVHVPNSWHGRHRAQLPQRRGVGLSHLGNKGEPTQRWPPKIVQGVLGRVAGRCLGLLAALPSDAVPSALFAKRRQDARHVLKRKPQLALH